MLREAWRRARIDSLDAHYGFFPMVAAETALAEGFSPADIGEALTLASNQLILRDQGRPPREEVPGKPVGSVHGDSIGVHACDSANAWRNLKLDVMFTRATALQSSLSRDSPSTVSCTPPWSSLSRMPYASRWNLVSGLGVALNIPPTANPRKLK